MEVVEEAGVESTPMEQTEEYCEDVIDGEEVLEDEDVELAGTEEEINGNEEYRQAPRGRGGFRGRGNRMEFGGPRMPPRFRGRGFGPRGPPPPGFRGPPPFGGPRGPRFRGGPPPPGYDPNWGPMPPPGPHMGPPGMGPPPPHMMHGGPMMPPPGGHFGPPPPGMGPPPNQNQPSQIMQGQGGQQNNQGPPSGPPGTNQGSQMANPPPNMNQCQTQLDLGSEFWIEAKSPEGKSYFYNARTRETTWTKPENQKIISQDQFEAMAQGSNGVNSSTTSAEDKNIEQNYPPGMGPPMNMGMPPSGFGGPPPGYGGPPPFGMPPPGFPFPGGFPPPWAAGPPGTGPPSGMGPPPPGVNNHQSTITGSPMPGTLEAQVDPEIVARASEWTEHRAPDGRFYYYNAKAGDSVWEKPQALKDLDTAKLAANQGIAMLPHPKAKEDKKEESKTEDEAKNGETGNKNKDEKMEEDGKSVDKVAAAALQQQLFNQDKSKPVSSNPVPGTPWCVVWTGDGRVFFYNPSSRTSVWERPEELSGRSDVDKLVSTPPEILAGIAAAAVSETSPVAAVKREAPAVVETTTPVKKQKLDSPVAPEPKIVAVEEKVEKNDKKAIDIGREAAMEAEVRAARERAIVPLDTRIKLFRTMLSEKDVSAFSTWEKELHKIVFDPRYLLLTSKERKQVFEKYVKERAEEERREKRNKMKERKEEFRRLMQDANLHGKSSFSDFASKYAKDERFKNIEKMRERESLFNEYILEVRKKEKEEKVQKRDQVKKDFISMLRESNEVDRHSRWADVKKSFDADPRYKLVDSSAQREDWFREFIKILKDERKREKERKEREKDKKDKGRSGSQRKEEEKENKPDKHEEEEKNEEENDAKEKEALEKQARVEASLREREKEVQRTLAVHLRDRDTEREHHKHDEAVQHFNALLADLVRNCELGWREAKRQLRKDHRWDLASLLDREEKEKLFHSHTIQLTLKKKEKFRELLNETPECTLSSSWKEVRKFIKDDPRYSKFSSSDRKCEREFKEYIKDKLVAAKADLRELLQETKLITHKSNNLVTENENHMKEIEEMLDKDKRWLILGHMVEERRELLKTYLVELEKKGPPPPPTACDPSRRHPLPSSSSDRRQALK